MINRETTHYETDTADFEVTCDLCGEQDFYDDMDWTDLMAAMKDDGWKNKKEGGGDWVHHCPKCAAKIQERLDR